MVLTYKVRLEPNNKQAGKFRQFAGAARHAYNWALEREKEAYDFISDIDLCRLFTKHKAEKRTNILFIKMALKSKQQIPI